MVVDKRCLETYNVLAAWHILRQVPRWFCLHLRLCARRLIGLLEKSSFQNDSCDDVLWWEIGFKLQWVIKRLYYIKRVIYSTLLHAFLPNAANKLARTSAGLQLWAPTLGHKFKTFCPQHYTVLHLLSQTQAALCVIAFSHLFSTYISRRHSLGAGVPPAESLGLLFKH